MEKMGFFGTVGEDITVDSVRSFLNANKTNDVQFDIATLGGDLNTGLLIRDLISEHPKKTTAYITGLTASAGTVIAMGCDEIIMSDNSLFLIHNGWKEVTGNVYDMEKAVKELAKMDAVMVKIYRERTGLPDNKIVDLMKAADWLSPEEAANYGFIDRISLSGSKIAASAIITEAQKGKVNQILILKLKEKMKNPFLKTKAKADVLNILALKEGKNLLINAEEAAIGVEVAPLGAATLEDGEFELADGRKIVVSGGVITEVKELEAAVSASEDEDKEEIVAAISAVVVAEIQKVEAKFMAELGKIKSTHVPAKGVGVASAKVDNPVDVTSKVKSITDGIFQKISESRKA